jgi:hypothetical protein
LPVCAFLPAQRSRLAQGAANPGHERAKMFGFLPVKVVLEFGFLQRMHKRSVQNLFQNLRLIKRAARSADVLSLVCVYFIGFIYFI